MIVSVLNRLSVGDYLRYISYAFKTPFHRGQYEKAVAGKAKPFKLCNSERVFWPNLHDLARAQTRVPSNKYQKYGVYQFPKVFMLLYNLQRAWKVAFVGYLVPCKLQPQRRLLKVVTI